MLKQYRQGDVLIEQIDEIVDSEFAPERADRVVLAYGEVTGHAHALVGDIEVLYPTETARPETPQYLRVVAGLNASINAELQHEEHSTIAVPPGLYRVTRQREWTDADEPRQVAD